MARERASDSFPTSRHEKDQGSEIGSEINKLALKAI